MESLGWKKVVILEKKGPWEDMLCRRLQCLIYSVQGTKETNEALEVRDFNAEDSKNTGQ